MNSTMPKMTETSVFFLVLVSKRSFECSDTKWIIFENENDMGESPAPVEAPKDVMRKYDPE